MRNVILSTAAVALAAPRAFANEAGAAAKAERVEPQLTAVAALPLPERVSKRGSESKYPFASLTAVGMAFGVKNKTAVQLSSIISNANRKAMVDRKDANGNIVYKTKEIKAPDGSVTIVPTTEAERDATAHYFAFEVTDEYRKANKDAFAKGGAFEGATVLVFRDK